MNPDSKQGLHTGTGCSNCPFRADPRDMSHYVTVRVCACRMKNEKIITR